MNDVSTIKPGTRIKNRYEILCLIGQGGFGATYKAIDNLINRFVAIKVSKMNLSHEAHVLKELKNVPHISHIYDYFVENHTYFIVMRLITGTSLTSYQKECGGTIPSSILKQMLPSVLITLDQMHQIGIIHRDISPGNFLLTDENTLYLIDFGAATSINQKSLVNNLIFKHKGFDSPEQKDINSQGPWTDIYSLCCTIYYLLVGEGVPLPADRMNYDPVPSMLMKVSLTNKMQNAIIRGLSTDITKRYQCIHDFSMDFFGNEKESDFGSKSYKVHYHARTDIGTRPINQDNFMVDTLFSYAGEDCEIKGYIDCDNEDLHVVALADGVASQNHGELASKAAIQAVSHFIDAFRYSKDLPQQLIEDFLDQLNEKIITLGNKIGTTASTVTIFLWKNNKYCIANIGDSPAYQLSDRKLSCLTVAHTLVNDKISAGKAVSAKDLHVITRYLGKHNIAGSEMASIKTGTISKGDIFLLCSDGVSNEISDLEKRRIMKKDGDKAIQSLFKHVGKQANMDNCTAIILKF